MPLIIIRLGKMMVIITFLVDDF